MSKFMYYVALLLLFFAPLSAELITLEKAERIALDNNKDICTLSQLYQSAKQGRLVSISKWLPQVDLISSGYKTQIIQTVTRTRSAFISQFNLTQALFSTDRYYNVKISTLQVEQLRLLLEAKMIDVLFDVRAAYYQVVLDYQNIETNKINIEILSNLAQRMQSNFNRGTAILLNVNQSKVAIANATSSYYQAIKQLQINLDILVELLGSNPGSLELVFEEKEIPIFQIPEIATKVNQVLQIFEQSQDLIYKPDFPETEEMIMQNLFSEMEMEMWEQTALALRPDLKSKCTDLKIASTVVLKEKGTFLPEVDFEFNYGGYPTYTQFLPSSRFTNQKLNWAFGFTFSWHLFEGFGRIYQVKQARYERNARQCAYKKELQLTYEFVRKEIYSIAESVASYATAEGNVALAKQTLELADKQLDIGYITVFDYQIVVNGLIQALFIRDQARYDLIRGYYGLRHASGYDLKGM